MSVELPSKAWEPGVLASEREEQSCTEGREEINNRREKDGRSSKNNAGAADPVRALRNKSPSRLRHRNSFAGPTCQTQLMHMRTTIKRCSGESQKTREGAARLEPHDTFGRPRHID